MPTLKNTRSAGLELLKGVTTRSPCILNRREAAAIATDRVGIPYGEFERDLIRERTSARREAAQKRGVQFGRPRKLSIDQAQLARRLVLEGKSVSDIAKGTLARALEMIIA